MAMALMPTWQKSSSPTGLPGLQQGPLRPGGLGDLLDFFALLKNPEVSALSPGGEVRAVREGP